MRYIISYIGYNKKKFIIFFCLILVAIFGIFENKLNEIKRIEPYFKEISFSYYKKYIFDCYKLKKYKRKKINNDIPYFSITLATYNMENYIENTILSIMNQSFQDFEIVIVNDYSTDNTLQIINRIKLKNNKIKLINHSKNLGLLATRMDCIQNSRGKYIILMDPDDMLLDPNLLNYLYKYNLKYNLDIIEFTILWYLAKKKYLYKPKILQYHYHNFSENIIKQPLLSELVFYIPNTKKYSSVICTSSRNKIFRKEILLKTVNYIDIDYYKEFVLTSEDTFINIISYQFANNYSNIDFPGYMYNIREKSVTHGVKDKKQKILFDYNYLIFNKILYGVIKDFNKDRNFLFYDLKRTNSLLLQLRKLSSKLKPKVNEFYKEIIKDNKISKKFKNYILNLLK
jgi:glycosyltransferase involved in cell wall biosynthesis